MEIFGLSGLSILKLIKENKTSKQEIFEYFLSRIKKYNGDLNAFLTIQETNSNSGMPIAIKDNVCTKDIRTTASAKVLDNFIPPYNATIMEKLNSEFSILGKTNMDAWAHGSSTETSDYGPTKNPFDLERVPGGSSGGSAAAVAAYLAPWAIGTETAGSIRQPAAWCGLVGLKPTYGRVSRYGIIAMGSSLDCPGPMTRTVDDAAFLLSKIAGHDPYDATSSTVETEDYLKKAHENKKMTIGISEEYFEGVDEEVKKSVYDAINLLEKKGHKTKRIKLISPKYSISVYTILQRAEVSSNLSRYDGIRFGNDRTFFGKEAKRRIMLGTYTLSYGYYDAYYKKALKVRNLIVEDFKKAFAEVDVILAPTTPMTALKIGDWEKYPFFGEVMDVLNEPAAISGLPALNIPVGLDKNGLPIGMQIIGRHFAESQLLDLGYQFEKETNFFGILDNLIKKYI